ncbi:hypothetical protein ACS0TY_029294 [Phlomoides rotata]
MQPPVFPFETENSTALFVADGLPPLLAADGRPRLPLLQFVRSCSFTASINQFYSFNCKIPSVWKDRRS